MSCVPSRRRPPRRQGVAATELAILLPFLAFVFVVALDWSRLFYYSVIITNCARNGALYNSDPYRTNNSPYADVTAAALADATNLSPTPTVTSTFGTDAGSGSYTEVTVSWDFKTITNFPGVPQTTTITRMIRTGVAQRTVN